MQRVQRRALAQRPSGWRHSLHRCMPRPAAWFWPNTSRNSRAIARSSPRAVTSRRLCTCLVSSGRRERYSHRRDRPARGSAMSHVFQPDGTTRPSSPRSDYSKKGNRQEYSIFGWANEPASLRDAKSETQRMLNAAQESSQSTTNKVAGVRTNGADWKIPHRPCAPLLAPLRRATRFAADARCSAGTSCTRTRRRAGRSQSINSGMATMRIGLVGGSVTAPARDEHHGLSRSPRTSRSATSQLAGFTSSARTCSTARVGATAASSIASS